MQYIVATMSYSLRKVEGSLLSISDCCVPRASRSVAIESFSYEWEVVTVSYGTVRAVTVLRNDRAISKHSDWLSNDFARCDWLNTMSSIPYHDRNSVP